MFGFLKGDKTYFINYTIYLDERQSKLNHTTVTVKHGRKGDLVLDVVKHLAKQHDCLKEQIIINALNVI